MKSNHHRQNTKSCLKIRVLYYVAMFIDFLSSTVMPVVSLVVSSFSLDDVIRDAVFPLT